MSVPTRPGVLPGRSGMALSHTVSESTAGPVCRYIQNQEEHHRERSFEEEWIALLKRHGIEFDPANPFG